MAAPSNPLSPSPTTIESLPDEVLCLIAASLVEPLRVEEASSFRNEENLEDLTNFRLVNKRFADAGARVLLSHLVIYLSRETEAGANHMRVSTGSNSAPPGPPSTWQDFVVSRYLYYASDWAAAKENAKLVKTATFWLNCWRNPKSKIDVSGKELATHFENFGNVETARIALDGVDGRNREYADANMLLDLAHWTEGTRSLLLNLGRLRRVVAQIPECALFWVGGLPSVRTLDLDVYQYPGPSRDWAISDSSFGTENNLETLTIGWNSCEWNMERTAAGLNIDFSNVICTKLRHLKLKRCILNSSVSDFITRCGKTLTTIDLTRQFDNDYLPLLNWDPVFQSLADCFALHSLRLSGGFIVANRTVSLEMPLLNSLELQDVTLSADMLTRLIRANKDSLVNITLRKVELTTSEIWRAPDEEGVLQLEFDADWASVFDAQLECSRLAKISVSNLTDLYLPPPGSEFFDLDHLDWDLEKTWNRWHPRGKFWRSNPSFSLYDAPDYRHKGWGLGGESGRPRELKAHLHAYCKLGELVRTVCERSGDWKAVEPPSCRGWFTSLYPLADIKSGKATLVDKYPWDPVRGVRVEELKTDRDETAPA